MRLTADAPLDIPQCGSLPIALAARGHRVMVVSPAYRDFGAEPTEVSFFPHCLCETFAAI